MGYYTTYQAPPPVGAMLQPGDVEGQLGGRAPLWKNKAFRNSFLCGLLLVALTVVIGLGIGGWLDAPCA